MRHIKTAAILLALSAATAHAGGMAEPVMEPEVIAEAASSSSQDIVVPLLAQLLFATAVSSN